MNNVVTSEIITNTENENVEVVDVEQVKGINMYFFTLIQTELAWTLWCWKAT